MSACHPSHSVLRQAVHGDAAIGVAVESGDVVDAGGEVFFVSEERRLAGIQTVRKAPFVKTGYADFLGDNLTREKL